ncbi:SDR family oxidoreductase [Serratia grimesii]|uniref:SDR family oxidoreductase n=1 Tax=Serratia grimesii TaxID=82995 RepID=UPI002240B01A|nr:SDR family NAD(P)-dependent oxidoreductase [Serratia grimesii]
MMKLSGNTILVTGGGSGIGRGLAEALFRSDNSVIIAGRRESALKRVCEENPGMQYQVMDISEVDNLAEVTQHLVTRFPELNVLINNAGVQFAEDLTHLEPLTMLSSIATNMTGPMILTSTLLPHLLTQSESAVINVTSDLAFMPYTRVPSYCAAKAGLHSWTESLRFQLRESRIHVIEITPPMVQTDLHGSKDSQIAMPLDDFIEEVMVLLQSDSQSKEINVERSKLFRFAERNGKYDEIFLALNSHQ